MLESVIICSSPDEAREVALRFGLTPGTHSFVFFDDPAARLEGFSTDVRVFAVPPAGNNFVESSIYVRLLSDLTARGFEVREVAALDVEDTPEQRLIQRRMGGIGHGRA